MLQGSGFIPRCQHGAFAGMLGLRSLSGLISEFGHFKTAFGISIN